MVGLLLPEMGLNSCRECIVKDLVEKKKEKAEWCVGKEEKWREGCV